MERTPRQIVLDTLAEGEVASTDMSRRVAGLLSPSELRSTLLDLVESGEIVFTLERNLRRRDGPATPAPEPERVLCAAIWVNNGEVYPHQPAPVEVGIVLCGLRHHQIFVQAALLERPDLRWPKKQGFLTSRGRFVNRFEAFGIASAAGQLVRKTPGRPGELYSEDLY